MAGYAPGTWDLHPAGVSAERMKVFCDEVGAEFIIVPNLETSEPDDQAEWFSRLAARGVVPRRVELGNEFWIATLDDPESLARFPDYRPTMKLSRRYVDALRPYLPPDALVAVQAAGVQQSVIADPGPQASVAHRNWLWDEALEPEDWFHATTIHFYRRSDRSRRAARRRPRRFRICSRGPTRAWTEPSAPSRTSFPARSSGSPGGASARSTHFSQDAGRSAPARGSTRSRGCCWRSCGTRR
jgi:hypothetical protein